jgi:hypothetical protein
MIQMQMRREATARAYNYKKAGREAKGLLAR